MPGTLGSLRDALDRDGCAYGQVTRERLDNVADRIERMESKLNFVVGSVVVQLFSFLLAVLLFVLNHVKM